MSTYNIKISRDQLDVIHQCLTLHFFEERFTESQKQILVDHIEILWDDEEPKKEYDFTE